MKKFMIAITLLLFLTSVAAQAQQPWRSPTHDVYNALQKPADITIDGELDDAEGWEGVFDTVTGTNGDPFCGIEFENIGAFEKRGGSWPGPEDHETCFAIVWDADAIYLAISVTDDEHENASGSGWNGDSTQLAAVPSGIREDNQQHILWNVALADNGNITVNNEKLHGNPGLEKENVIIVRNEDEKETYYEIKITPENMGLKNSFEEGYEFGLGICVNDGDKDALGQKGWSGWYPHSIVDGKSSQKTGLVKLTDETLAVEAKNKLTTTWGRLKSTR